jgi:hypothetical protein
MSKHTTLDIKDTACLHIVQNLQLPTSRPTTKSMQSSMVDAPKQHILSPLAGKYIKSTLRSRQQLRNASEGNTSLEAESVRALGEWRSLRSKKELAAETQ